MDKNYSLIIDTNVFDLQKELDDFSEPYLFFKIEELVNKFEINDIISKINVCIPKVVLMEFAKQQDERYEDEMKKFLGKTYPLFTPQKRENYMSWLNKKFIKYLKENNNFGNSVFVLDYPSGKSFKNIINRAILKQEPFEGKNGKSDKGFKDALIWQTLLEYKTSNPTTKIILFSNDSKLTSEYCQKEYKHLFNDDLIIAKNVKEPYLDEVIKKEFDLDKIELSLENKLKNKLLEKIENNLEFTNLIGKFIYSKMGEKEEICEVLDPNFRISNMGGEEDLPAFYVWISVRVGVKHKDDVIFEELQSGIEISYNFEKEKFMIEASFPIHSDFSDEEYYNLIKFIEE